MPSIFVDPRTPRDINYYVLAVAELSAPDAADLDAARRASGPWAGGYHVEICRVVHRVAARSWTEARDIAQTFYPFAFVYLRPIDETTHVGLLVAAPFDLNVPVARLATLAADIAPLVPQLARGDGDEWAGFDLLNVEG